jgi:hypothetical protein
LNPFEETFLLWTGFFTKLGPQIRLPPVPNFGVNKWNISNKLNMDRSAWRLAINMLEP